MNHTTPRRLTVATVAPVVDGTARIAPYPMGTWFSRWHHVYTAAPAAIASGIDADVLTHQLPRPSALTTAA